MKIALLGATGFVGQALLKKLLTAGYEVNVLARNPDKLGEFNNSVTVIPGNYFEAEKIEATLRGTPAVLSTIGPLGKNVGTPAQYEQAMITLIAAMHKHQMKRIIWVGGAPTAFNGERLGVTRSLLKFSIDLFWGKRLLQIKNREFALLAQSGLDWTFIRPPQILKGALPGKVIADEHRLAGLQIGVEDVADFMVAQIMSDRWIKKAPLIASKK